MVKSSTKSLSNRNQNSIDVLISTMNQEDPIKLAKNMRVNNYVMINQLTKDITVPKKIMDGKSKIISVNEKGLSRSRNEAILNSNADICVIADDDMYYSNQYELNVSNGYKKYPDADIIAYYVDSDDKRHIKEKLKEGKLSMLTTMKIASMNITFRRQTIIDSHIKFDENFGTGTENYMGEENIFLFDCYKYGLKIYYIPIKIATLRKDSISTWFNGYDKKYFTVKGRVFTRMSKLLALPFVLQFAVRKIKLYRSEMSIWLAVKYMVIGMKRESNNEK